MRSRGRDWRVRHRGRDALSYEERHEGAWRRLELNGEMLVGRTHHVIYFGAKADWASQPEWARERRAEILARVKQACPMPVYAYEGEEIFDAHDRALLIEREGGLSSEECVWAGCTERALANRRVCIDHTYPPEVWSRPGRPTSAST